MAKRLRMTAILFPVKYRIIQFESLFSKRPIQMLYIVTHNNVQV